MSKQIDKLAKLVELLDDSVSVNVSNNCNLELPTPNCLKKQKKYTIDISFQTSYVGTLIKVLEQLKKK